MNNTFNEAGNASTTLPTSLLRASTRLLSHFFQDLQSFDEEDSEVAGLPSPPKTFGIVSAITEMAINLL